MGFKFHETMKGTYSFKDKENQERALFFEVDCVAENGLKFLKDFMCEMHGFVTMAGVADNKPLYGTLEIALFTRRELVYDFEFTGNDGKSYRFIGKKINISPFTVLKTMTTLCGKVFCEGEEIAESLLRFELGDLPEFMLSWKPTI